MASNSSVIPHFDSTTLLTHQDQHSNQTQSQGQINIQNDTAYRRKNVTFIFSQGDPITDDIQTLKDIGPAHYAKLSFLLSQDSTLKIKLPEYIGQDELKNFIGMIKNGIFVKHNNFSNDFVPIIQTSEFFQNDQLTRLIINDLALKTLDIKNAFGYLEISYDKIRFNANKKISIDKAWHTLLFSSLNLIGIKLIGVLKNDELSRRINKFDKRIQEEIIMRFIHLYYNSELCFEEESEDMVLLINFIGTSRHKSNFFEVLNHDYLALLSEAVNDRTWKGEYTPAFHVDLYKHIQGDVNEEYEIEYSIHKFVIVLEYIYACDRLTIKMRLKDDEDKEKMKIVTFISQAIIDNQAMTPMRITISNDKGIIATKKEKKIINMTTLLAVDDLSTKYNIIRDKKVEGHQVYHMKEVMPLKATIENNGIIQLINGRNWQLFRSDYLQISLKLKVCYVYSFLSTFFLSNFALFYNDNKVSQLPYDLFDSLIKNIGDQAEDTNKALMVLHWRKYIYYHYILFIVSDERNGSNDLDRVFKCIKWSKVDIKVLFDIALILNEKNQCLLLELVKKEEYAKLDYRDVIEKILCIIPYIYICIVIGKKIDYSKLIKETSSSNNKKEANNEDNDKAKSKTNNENNLYINGGIREETELNKMKLVKYDFSYTISKAIQLNTNNTPSNSKERERERKALKH